MEYAELQATLGRLIQSIARKNALVSSKELKTIPIVGVSSGNEIGISVSILRGALTMRARELSRVALACLTNGECASLAIQVRAHLETLVVLWDLSRELNCYADNPSEAQLALLGSFLKQALLGEHTTPRNAQATDQKNLSILTRINRIDKQFVDVREAYDQLSEAVHPNWWGGGGLFAAYEDRAGAIRFGSPPMIEAQIKFGGFLDVQLDMFIAVENRIIGVAKHFSDTASKHSDE